MADFSAELKEFEAKGKESSRLIATHTEAAPTATYKETSKTKTPPKSFNVASTLSKVKLEQPKLKKQGDNDFIETLEKVTILYINIIGQAVSRKIPKFEEIIHHNSINKNCTYLKWERLLT